MDTTRTYTTMETIERKAIESLLGRMTPTMGPIIKRQLIRSLANGIAIMAAQKKEIEELEQYAEQVAAKGSDWGAW